MRLVGLVCLVLSTAAGCTTTQRKTTPQPDVAATPDDALNQDATTDDVTAPEGDAAMDELPVAICRAGGGWQPGAPAFRDVTATSGLAELGVAGIRLSAADIDGDGLADLSVRQHKVGQNDDFSAEGARYTWLLKSDGDLSFTDVTESSGFLTRRNAETGGRVAHVVVWGDVDNDGDLDAFAGVHSSDTGKAGTDRTEILRNDGAGNFVLVDSPGDVQPGQDGVSTTSAAFVDLDRDGNLDLYVGVETEGQSFGLDKVFLGDGTGAFVDSGALLGMNTVPAVSIQSLNSGVAHKRTWGVTACDLNNDAFVDILTSSYGRGINGLWLSDGTGGWNDASMASGFGKDDGVGDDWTTNLNAQCFCKLTPSADGCDTAPEPPNFFSCQAGQQLRWNHDQDREPFRLGGNTFSTVCGDIDNDGDMDVMSFEIVHWDVGESSDTSQLLLNDGAGNFTRPGLPATGMVRDWDRLDWNAGDMTGALLDFDSDGRLDIYIGSSDYPGTRGFLYHQKADGTFEEVTPDVGIDHPRSHGLAIADYDGDGDLDMAIGHSRSRCDGPDDPTCYKTNEVHLFENLAPAANQSIIQLVGGAGANHAGIGARVTLTAGGVTQTRQVDGGHGHFGIQHGTALHFGLGTECEVASITVRWPDVAGTVQTIDGPIRANYRLIVEKSGGLTYGAALE